MSVGNCGGKWLVLFYGDQTLRPEEILVYRMEFTDNVTRFFLPRGIRGTTKECNSLSRSNRLHSQRDKAEVSTEKGLTNPLSAGWSCCKRRVRHDKLAAREQWRHQSQKKKKKKVPSSGLSVKKHPAFFGSLPCPQAQFILRHLISRIAGVPGTPSVPPNFFPSAS